MSVWSSVASIFLPQMRPPKIRSPYEDDPERARKERPLPTTTTTRWLQSDVEDARRMADNGDLALAARLARSVRTDGTIGGLLGTRTGGLMRLPKMFRGTPEVVAALDKSPEDDIGLFDRIFAPKELARFIADGIVLGVAIGELVWLPHLRHPVFVRLDPEFLRYRWAEDRWYYRSIAGELPITPGDGRWILHTPGGYQAPWQNAMWESLSRSFIAKDHAFNFRENYSSKLAHPARAAYAPAGATEPQRRGFLRRVIAWGINTVFELPPGWEVKLIESNGKGYEVFAQTIETSDRESMIALAGQIVTTTGGVGFANADIHATIRGDIIQDDGDGAAATINEQGLRPVVNLLFGGAARGSVAWDSRPPADRKAEADAMSACAKAIEDMNKQLAPHGLCVDVREMTTRYKVPVVAIQVPAQVPANDTAPPPAAQPSPPALQEAA